MVSGMVRDAAATKARILQAAIMEFAAVGMAGARVDRIAGAAGADKKLIYNYFTDKESLFDACLQASLTALVGAVPIDEHDLPGYAGRLFDYVTTHPEAHRLTMWRRLERPDAGPDDHLIYEEKVNAMLSGPPDRHQDPLPPVDLLVIVQAMAGAWAISPLQLLSADGADPTAAGRLAVHRQALLTSVRRIIDPHA
jgi:AcrR family transcriptional regulator